MASFRFPGKYINRLNIRFQRYSFSITEGYVRMLKDTYLTTLYVIERRDRIIISSFMNDTPDMVYVPDFDEGYHGDGDYIVDEIYKDVDFVSLYTEFTDGTSSDVHIKYIEGGRRRTPSNEFMSA